MVETRTPTAILISGRGSNMRALIAAARAPDYPAKIALIVSNRPDAGGLAFAAGEGIETAIVDHRPFGRNREAFERALDEVLNRAGVRFLCLAGFMRVLTPWFVRRWRGRMLNIHPSLLPAFPGTDTHARALRAGVSEHGCTVHWVVPEVDAGPIVGQAKVAVLPGDTEGALGARVLEQEWKLYPEALSRVLRQAGAEPFAVIEAPGGGCIGVARCPGRDRPIEDDVAAFAAWGAEAVLTLTEFEELARVDALALPDLLMARGIAWHHLPIRDFGAPSTEGHARWRELAPRLLSLLEGGGRIVVHCFGGQGRSGMIAARLLVLRGMSASDAIASVRRVRSGAIETSAQEAWVASGAPQEALAR